MRTSVEMMRKIRREIVWGGAIWFLWGISHAAGNWLQIEALKPQKDSALLWFGFGGMVVLFVFMADCTEAILARISETVGPESRGWSIRQGNHSPNAPSARTDGPQPD